MDRRDRVILVDRSDRKIGVADKMAAHSNGGRLHRSISIFVFNRKGEMLLQRRAMGKYHAPGKWSNTCCSHQQPGEKSLTAAHRRLVEEMGFDCRLREAFHFPYKTYVDKGLTEQEYDHMIFGRYDGKPRINRREVMDWKWMPLMDLRRQVKRKPGSFTPWFRLMVDKVISRYSKGF